MIMKARIFSSVAVIWAIFVGMGCAVADPMPPVLDQTIGVVWDSTQGFTGIRNESGVSSTQRTIDPVVGEIYHMTYSGDGQNEFGGGIDDRSMNSVIADARQLNVRYLIKFGTSQGQPEWSEVNRTVMGNVWGYELKAFDIHNGNTSERIIMMVKPASGPNDHSIYAGTLEIRIDGRSGEVQVEPPAGSDGMNTIFDSSGVWYYCEVQISEDGSVRYWFAPYDGSGTEYSLASPQVELRNAHTFDFDWLRTSHFNFGYRNHAIDGTRTIDARLSISTSFIGPLSN